MINVFRTYNLFNVVWLALLVLVLRVCYLVFVPHAVPLQLVEPFMDNVWPLRFPATLSGVASVMLGAVIVLGQAVLLNYLINKYNLLGRPSFLPGAMYIVIASLFTQFLLLSGPMLCNFIVIWMLFKIMFLYRAEDGKTTAFDLGMLTAIGSLIYLPFIYLLLVVWIALAVLRPLNWRDWMASVIGYLTIFFFVGVIYYLTDRLPYFYRVWQPLATPLTWPKVFNKYQYLLLMPVAIVLVFGFFKLQENFFKSYVLIRKVFQLLSVLVVIAGLAIYVHPVYGLSHFLLCVVPLAVFFAYYFLYARKRWFYETLFFLLLASIIYFQFNTF